MEGMPSVQNIRHNGTGGMRSFCFTAVAPMKCCVIIWEGCFVKIKNDSGIMEWWNDGTMKRSNRDEKSKLECN